MRRIKVVVLYRVLLHYRIPVFERLSLCEDLDVVVLHGCDFPGTKIVNSKESHTFCNIQLPSIPIRTSTSNGLAVAPFSPSLILKLIKLKPDVILCEGASNLPNNIIAYIYSLMSGVSIIQWGLGEIRGWRKSFLRRSLDFIVEFVERKSAACVAYSSLGKEYYHRVGVPNDSIFVAVNVVDTDKVKNSIDRIGCRESYRKKHKDAEFVVLFVGALNIEKRVDLLIEAFSEFVQSTSSDAKLYIIGDGDCRFALESMVAPELENKIRFTGQVIDGVSHYFTIADIFVLPGLGGLAVSEALAHGVPVIATIGDGCEVDLLAEGAGILDDKLDVCRLKNHLDMLYNDREKLNNMSVAAKSVIQNKYNITNYITKLHEAIHWAAR